MRTCFISFIFTISFVYAANSETMNVITTLSATRTFQSALGINAWRKIGLELIPKVDIPFVIILTRYPGGSPENIEQDVARKIEDAVASVEGLKRINTSCMENVCTIALEFQLEVDVTEAANDVRDKLDLILNDLPSNVERSKIFKIALIK